MKLFSFFKIVALTSLLVFASCSKENDNNPSVPTPTPAPAPTPTPQPTATKFAAKVDGTPFATDDSKAKAKFVSSTKMLQIIGQNADQTETIYFNLLPFGTSVSGAADWLAGTYDFDPIHISNLEYQASAMYTKYENSEYMNWSTKWDYVQNGKIIIESNTGTHIKGTFYFDAVKQNNSDGTFDASNIKKVTEGSFDLDIAIY